MKIKTKIQQYSQKTLHRYLVIGGSVYVFEVLIILLAQKLGATPVTAVGIGFWVGLVVSFLLTKFVTFSDKRKSTKVVASQALAYGALVLFNFLFTILVAKIFENIFPAVVSRTISLAITTIWNYFLYKKHIFSKYTEIM